MSLTPIVPTAGSLTIPTTNTFSSPMLLQLTQALGVPRDVLASDEEIEHACLNLPRLISRIPIERRSETIVRMVVAVATGLFDSGINYAWNAAVIELREKVRRFGLAVVPQVTGRPFDETVLVELRDADLLQLCLKLNLISEEGFFLLDQCRDIRNNFSAAHPSMGSLDETEFLSFVNRCAKHALSSEDNPRGVDIQGFIAAVNGPSFSAPQLEAWAGRLSQTFDAQREMLFGTLHGIYCDPAKGEQTRVNALWVCERLAPSFTPRTKSDLVDRHQDYLAKGDEPRHKASLLFFERLSLLSLLGETALHALITSASRNLMTVHNNHNNFYNEPPFAERLAAVSGQGQVPASAQFEFVSAVITCATGNPWGTSTAALGDYYKMIRSFSPNEINIMLHLPDSNSVVGSRIRSNTRCKTQYAKLVQLLNTTSVPTPARTVYDNWMKVPTP